MITALSGKNRENKHEKWMKYSIQAMYVSTCCIKILQDWWLQEQLKGDIVNRDDEGYITTYKVVINHEEQFSIWPADRANAPGWRDTGQSGSKEVCLAYIKEVWTDMRPLSLRKQTEATPD